jgi:hypothetical protein
VIWVGVVVLCLVSVALGALIAVMLERGRDSEVFKLSTAFDTAIHDGDAPEIPMRRVDMERSSVLSGQRATIRFEDGREWPVLFADEQQGRDGDPCPRCHRPTFVVAGTGGTYGCDCLPD